METLRAGGLAYHDSFSGLVPVKVRAVTYEDRTGDTIVLYTVTAARPGWPKGYLGAASPRYVVPRKAVYRPRGAAHNRIRPYSMVRDDGHVIDVR